MHRTSTHRVKLNKLSTAGHLVQTLWPGMDSYIVNTNFGGWMNIHKSQLTFDVHQLCHDDHEIFPHYPHLPTIYLAKLQSGWWLTYPSEKYESQIGSSSQLLGKIKMFQTTNQNNSLASKYLKYNNLGMIP